MYHFDGTGHTVAITDKDNAVKNRYAYSPYGKVLSQEQLAQPFKYAGQVGILTETDNLYYMRARYYDADVGRFISEDPAGFIDGPNLYAYVGGNPTNLVDPTGLSAQKGQDNSDLKFTYGIQAGARVGLTKILGAKIDIDMGSREISLVTGNQYVNENYTLSLDVAGFSFGLDAYRNAQITNFTFGQDSIHGVLSGQSFEFSPAFQTPWGSSSQEFWQIDFGASFMLGIEGKLDFD